MEMKFTQAHRAALILLLLLGGALLLVPLAQKEPTAIPLSEFISRLIGAEHVAIVMDIRGADEGTSQKILQCGVSLAGSPLFAGKDLANYACDGSGCVAGQGNSSQRTIPFPSLEGELAGRTSFFIRPGTPQSAYYSNPDRAIISLDSSFLGECGLGLA